MRKLISAWCLLAGLTDSTTGVLLVSAPATTLRLMGIAEVPSEPVFLRWIGVFVGGVGLLYLYPWLGDAARREERQRVILEATIVLRGAVAVFVIVSLTRGLLSMPWVSVAVTDAMFAGFQVFLLTLSSRPVAEAADEDGTDEDDGDDGDES